MNGWERLPVDMGSSLEPLLPTSYLLTDTASCEPEIFFNSLFVEIICTTFAEQTNIYARSKLRTAGQGMDTTDTMTHFIHRQHACHKTWKYVNSTDIKMFKAHLIITGLVHKSRIGHYWSTSNFTKTSFFGKYMLCNLFQNIP